MAAGLVRAAVACLSCAAIAILTPGVAGARDPFGRAKPYTGPPIVQVSPGEPNHWIRLAHQPRFSPESMLLMSNGTVLVHDYNSVRWEALVPDRHGSYVRGTWHRVAAMPGGYRPMFFASAVLSDGRVVVTGGEYDGGSEQIETNRGAVYDPTTNTWTSLAPPLGWSEIGDAQSTVLDNGRMLVASLNYDDALLDPRNLTWTTTGTGKRDENTEEGFSLLPDGRVLTVDTTKRGSELFDPKTGAWSTAGKIPRQLIDSEGEQGPLVSGPNGAVFAVGATGRTATYRAVPGARGSWSAGPRIPAGLVAADAAGARLPNGDVLIDASPRGQVAPTFFYLYNGHRFRSVRPDRNFKSGSSFSTRMLVLPTGEVLYDDTYKMYVFRFKDSPRESWRPSITLVRRQLRRGATYRLSGRQLAGRDQGAAYGDDFQDDTNYPLVHIVNSSSRVVTYARTFDWSTFSTAPGARGSTRFALPRHMPLGRSTLVVVANGIASEPVTVTITR